MREDLEKQIYDAAPAFFQDRDKDCRSTCMCWGIECGDGWFQPIMDFAMAVEALNDSIKDTGCVFVCDQMKSKWADFTCYWSLRHIDRNDESMPEQDGPRLSTATWSMDALVSRAVEECSHTCELCGKLESFLEPHYRCGSWITVKCQECAQKPQRDNGVVNSLWQGFRFLDPLHMEDGVEIDGAYYSRVIGAYYSLLSPSHAGVFSGMDDNEVIQNTAVAMGLPKADDEAADIMKRVLRARYEQSELDRAGLASVRGMRIEPLNHSCDNFWGKCVCRKCSEIQSENRLGRILMELSEELS